MIENCVYKCLFVVKILFVAHIEIIGALFRIENKKKQLRLRKHERNKRFLLAMTVQT